MARNTSSILLLSSLLHLCASYLVLIESQLLPIVHDKGGNTPSMQTYIIHVQELEGGTKRLGEEDLKSWHKSFLPNATIQSRESQLLYSYPYRISGFTARLNAEEVSAMESMHGFLYAHLDNELVGATSCTTLDFLGLGQLMPMANYECQGRNHYSNNLTLESPQDTPSFGMMVLCLAHR